jgi:hypothetical protein
LIKRIRKTTNPIAMDNAIIPITIPIVAKLNHTLCEKLIKEFEETCINENLEFRRF